MKTRKLQVYLTLVLIAFGFLLTVSYNNNVKLKQSISDTDWEKKQEFQEKMLAEQIKQQDLEKKLLMITEEVSDFEKETQSRRGSPELNELEQLRMWLGLVPVSGRGVVVTLQDNPDVRENDSTGSIVLEEHIRQVVNELFSAGAEGISINGQRLTAGSAIIYSGISILVNGTPIEAPFKISAIGDPYILKTALEMAGGVVQGLRNFSQIQVLIETKDQLDLPSYTGNGQNQAKDMREF